MMYVAFINVCFMLNALKRKFFPRSDLYRLCFEGYSCVNNDYRRMADDMSLHTNPSHLSNLITEDGLNMCDNCGNPVRECQLIECITEMVLNEIPGLCKRDCYGCQREAEGHFVHSQLDHDMCMMSDPEEKADRYTKDILKDIFKSQEHLDELWKSRMAILWNDIFTDLTLDECVEKMENERNNYKLDEAWIDKYYYTILEKVKNRGIYYDL